MTSLHRTAALWIAGVLLAFAFPTFAQPANVVDVGLAVSPDGQRVASGTSTGALLLWNADTWTLERRVELGSDVFGIHFSPDGRHLSFGTFDGRVVVMEGATGDVVFETQDRPGTVSATRLTADGRLFAAGQGRTLHSYDWTTGTRLQTYDLGRRSTVEDFEVDVERGWLFVARFDSQARLMDLATGAVLHTWRNKARPRDGARNIKNVSIRADGRTGVFAGVGGDVIAVDLVDGTRLDSVQVDPDFVATLQQSPDGALLATNALDGTTTLLDAQTLRVVQRWTQPASFESRRLLFAAAFRPGTNQLLTGGKRLPIIVWDASTGTRVRTIDRLPTSAAKF